MTNQIPNLDGMNRTELMSFWNQFKSASRQEALTLIGDRRRGYTKITAILARYAQLRAVSIRHRLDGNIAKALRNEDIADQIYQTLPKDLKW